MLKIYEVIISEESSDKHFSMELLGEDFVDIEVMFETTINVNNTFKLIDVKFIKPFINKDNH